MAWHRSASHAEHPAPPGIAGSDGGVGSWPWAVGGLLAGLVGLAVYGDPTGTSTLKASSEWGLAGRPRVSEHATKEMMQPCLIYLQRHLFGCVALQASGGSEAASSSDESDEAEMEDEEVGLDLAPRCSNPPALVWRFCRD